ncbi:MAG: hypothetical protein BMS9Abin01_0094 [Gammaproteobacteria bacterium]|nr:MAG: hypothetical protein BMS9Abin01_0094 [Gammaproteobacteria bacterium]
MPSYTAEELERATGFDRRTIAYYVQEGLIPRVGRRGPRTRYPELVRDRLLFIRRVREAEESGTVPPVSLSELRGIFERIPAELIASVADGQTPVTEGIVSRPSIAARRPARRRATIEARWAAREDQLVASESFEEPIPPAEEAPPAAKRSLSTPGASEPASVYDEQPPEITVHAMSMPPDEGTVEAELGDSLAALQEAARRRRKRTPGSMDTWSRIEISPEIALSVRGVSDEDAGLLEKVGEKLRQLISHRHRRRR